VSFWLGAILPTQTVLLIDRWTINQAKTYIPIPWRFRVKERSKFRGLNDHVVFLPAGSTYGSEKLFEIFRDHFRNEPFDVEDLRHFQSKFMEVAGSMWNGMKDEYERICRKSVGVTGIDCLVGGLDRAGKPFLVNVCDPHNFKFDIYEERGNWFALPQGAADGMIGDGIRDFFGVAMQKGEMEQRDIAKKLLSQLFLRVKQRNKFISPSYDLLFIGADFEMSGSRYLWGR
jgi:hypothetical protein